MLPRGTGSFGKAFVERVRSTYLAIAKAEPARVRVIDASTDIAQIRMDDVIAGQHIGDVARRGASRDP